jgi:hypothetical protein
MVVGAENVVGALAGTDEEAVGVGIVDEGAVATGVAGVVVSPPVHG